MSQQLPVSLELSINSVLKSLCYYDARNPLLLELGMYDDSAEQQPRVQCSCDNCFYGRDGLALEILRLRSLLPVDS